MGALRDEVERKEREVIMLRTTIDQNHIKNNQDKQDIHNGYSKSINGMYPTKFD
jgi:hypothetical protein